MNHHPSDDEEPPASTNEEVLRRAARESSHPHSDSFPGRWSDCAPGGGSIKELLGRASGELEGGELLHSRAYSLQMSLSAIELMDAKMDPGVGHADARTPERVAEEAAAAVAASATPEAEFEVGTMDELLCMEAMWWDGASLPDTVFTCAYAHSPALAPTPALRAFAEVQLRAAAAVRAAVEAGDVYHEEDFSPSPCGFSLEGTAGGDAGASAAAEKEERRLRERADELGGREAAARDPRGPAAYALAVAARLALARHSLAVHTELAREGAGGLVSCQPSVELALHALREVEATLPLGRSAAAEEARLALAAERAARAAREAEAGPPGQEEADERRKRDGRERDEDPDARAPGFDARVSRNAALGAVARLVPRPSRAEAVDAHRRMLGSVRLLAGLARARTLDEAVDCAAAVSRARPGIVARSHAAAHARTVDSFFALGPLPELLAESVRAYCQAAGVMRGTEHEAYFCEDAAVPVLRFVRLLLANRARQRRLVNKVVPELVAAMQLASSTDHELRVRLNAVGALPPPNDPAGPGPCTIPYYCWTAELAARLAAHHVRLGFELDLLAAHEVEGALWYYHRLVDQRLRFRSIAFRAGVSVDDVRAAVDVAVQEAARSRAEVEGGGGGAAEEEKKAAAPLSATAKKNRQRREKKKRARMREACAKAGEAWQAPPHGAELVLEDAERIACFGLLRAYQFFSRRGAARRRAYTLGSHEHAWQHRFATLYRLGVPTPVPAAAFVAHTRTEDGAEPAELNREALGLLTEARKRLKFVAASGELPPSEAGRVKALESACVDTMSTLLTADRKLASLGDRAHAFFRTSTQPGVLPSVVLGESRPRRRRRRPSADAGAATAPAAAAAAAAAAP